MNKVVVNTLKYLAVFLVFMYIVLYLLRINSDLILATAMVEKAKENRNTEEGNK